MMFKKEKKLNIDLGLKDLNLDFDLFPKSKKVRKFPKPRPHYTAKGKPFMTQKEKEILARKSKEAVKSTGSAFNSMIKKIKNRKINRLEKEHFKQKEKADALAHEIKLRLSIQDSNVDISRYEKELGIMGLVRDMGIPETEYGIGFTCDRGHFRDCICCNESFEIHFANHKRCIPCRNKGVKIHNDS